MDFHRSKKFIEKPTYPGGLKALRSFIKENLKYPEAAIKNKIEGSVLCSYKVDYKGKISEIKVLIGLGHGCDEEAVRLISLLKFSSPTIPKKRRAHFIKKLRIHFKLPNINKKEPVAISYKYSIPKNKEEKVTYSYYIAKK